MGDEFTVEDQALIDQINQMGNSDLMAALDAQGYSPDSPVYDNFLSGLTSDGSGYDFSGGTDVTAFDPTAYDFSFSQNATDAAPANPYDPYPSSVPPEMQQYVMQGGISPVMQPDGTLSYQDTYGNMMSADEASQYANQYMDLTQMGDDTMKKYLESQNLSPEQLYNVLAGQTTDGQAYDFSSPEQDKAMEAERVMLDKMQNPSWVQKAAQYLRSANTPKNATAAQLQKLLNPNAKTTKAQAGVGGLAMLAQMLGALQKGKQTPKAVDAGKAATGMKWKRFANGGHVIDQYAAGGQADKVPAMLSGGEYVMDADIVSALGDGSTDAGAAKLDQMREAVRSHKRSAPSGKIPPKAKSPLEYMKGAK